MKILFRIAIVLALLAALSIGALILFIDSAAKTTIEQAGTFAMGVDTKVESVQVGFISGKYGLSDLSIANPEGFGADNFFALQNARLEIDNGSLSGDTVVIPEILIEGVTLDIEQTPDGANYAKILENLQRFESGDQEPTSTDEPAGPADPGPDVKFVVRKISMSDVKANVKLDILGKQSEFTVPVPDFTIDNVGNSDDSQSISELLSTILQETLNSVAENGGGLLPEDMVADIKGQLGELESAAGTLMDGVGTDLQNILDGSGDTDDLKKNARDTIKASKEGLKGLLGKD